MSKVGRKPRAIPAVKRTFYLSEDVVASIELLLTDPTRQRYTVKYGAWSQLVEALLRGWVETQQLEAANDAEPSPVAR